MLGARGKKKGEKGKCGVSMLDSSLVIHLFFFLFFLFFSFFLSNV